MGDTIEITTWPHHNNFFYQVSSGAMFIEIKGQSEAFIGLAREPKTTCDYVIAIADTNGDSYIRHSGSNIGRKVVTPNILIEERYQKFWLSWYNKALQFGRHGETEPVLTAPCDPGLNYITFFTKHVGYNTGPVHWRFQLPPPQISTIGRQLGEPIKMKNVTGGSLGWVSPGDQLPDSALIGGIENEILYIIRAHHSGSVTPGKFVPSLGVGYIPWGGQAHSKGEFDVLCGFDCAWVKTAGNRIPVGAVIGGESELHSEPLYVGRAEHNGHLIPGKVQPSHNVCYIAFEGKEIAKEYYEILVEPRANIHCVNSIFKVDDTFEENSSSDDNYNSDVGSYEEAEEEDEEEEE